MRSDWFPRRDSRSWCTIAEHEGSTTLPEALPQRLPTNYPHDWHLDCGAPLVRTKAFELGLALLPGSCSTERNRFTQSIRTRRACLSASDACRDRQHAI